MAAGDDENFESMMQEITDISITMMKDGNIAEALSTAMRGLQLRKQHYGAGSPEFQAARVHVASIVLEAARLHQSHNKSKEAAELLVFVDNFTTEPLAQPALNRSRLLIRAAMLKELMIARQGQGRHRSALTFGRHFLGICTRLLLYHELPTAHLNIASVLSSMKLHEDALSHSFLAYQAVNKILAAVSEPEQHPVLVKAFEMEDLDKQGLYQKAYEVYEDCLGLVEEHGDPMDAADIQKQPTTFHVEGDADRQSHLSHVWWSAKQKKESFPCIALLVEMQEAASPPPTSVQQTMDNERKWGGVLALCFRSIAVEQEHLNQLSSALLTYRVATSTALQCLGEVHPVTIQCQSALKEAVEASHQRDLHRTSHLNAVKRGKKVAPKVSEPAPLRRRAATPSGLSTSSKTSMTEIRRTKPRPEWNPWFNSKGAAPSQTISMSAVEDNHTAASRAASPMSSMPLGYDLSPEPQVRPTTTAKKTHSTPQRHHARSPSPHEVDPATLPDLTPEDYAFLRQTFKLRHDPRFSAPKTSHRSRELEDHPRALKAEKRLAEALAAEMGIDTR